MILCANWCIGRYFYLMFFSAAADFQIPYDLMFINIRIIPLFAEFTAVLFASIIKRPLDTAWACLIYTVFVLIIRHRYLHFPAKGGLDNKYFTVPAYYYTCEQKRQILHCFPYALIFNNFSAPCTKSQFPFKPFW